MTADLNPTLIMVPVIQRRLRSTLIMASVIQHWLWPQQSNIVYGLSNLALIIADLNPALIMTNLNPALIMADLNPTVIMAHLPRLA